MLELHDRIAIGSGKQRDIVVLGVSPGYSIVRNLELPAGRFFDAEDAMARAKVALVPQQFARNVYGNEQAAIGQNIKISGLPFVIVGAYRERVETFGQSEIGADTILIPDTVARYFT